MKTSSGHCNGNRQITNQPTNQTNSVPKLHGWTGNQINKLQGKPWGPGEAKQNGNMHTWEHGKGVTKTDHSARGGSVTTAADKGLYLLCWGKWTAWWVRPLVRRLLVLGRIDTPPLGPIERPLALWNAAVMPHKWCDPVLEPKASLCDKEHSSVPILADNGSFLLDTFSMMGLLHPSDTLCFTDTYMNCAVIVLLFNGGI